MFFYPLVVAVLLFLSLTGSVGAQAPTDPVPLATAPTVRKVGQGSTPGQMVAVPGLAFQVPAEVANLPVPEGLAPELAAVFYAASYFKLVNGYDLEVANNRDLEAIYLKALQGPEGPAYQLAPRLISARSPLEAGEIQRSAGDLRKAFQGFSSRKAAAETTASQARLVYKKLLANASSAWLEAFSTLEVLKGAPFYGNPFSVPTRDAEVFFQALVTRYSWEYRVTRDLPMIAAIDSGMGERVQGGSSGTLPELRAIFASRLAPGVNATQTLAAAQAAELAAWNRLQSPSQVALAPLAPQGATVPQGGMVPSTMPAAPGMTPGSNQPGTLPPGGQLPGGLPPATGGLPDAPAVPGPVLPPTSK